MAPSRAQEILADGFGRVVANVDSIVGGLGVDELLWQPQPGANSIGWIVWHIGRMEDAQIADIAGTDQVWTGWVDRFDLPYPSSAHGYGQTADDVDAFRISDPALLTGYYRAVHAATLTLLDGLTDDDYDRMVDAAWDPPVTVAIRLVSVLDDAAQHVGQTAYLKGLLERR